MSCERKAYEQYNGNWKVQKLVQTQRSGVSKGKHILTGAAVRECYTKARILVKCDLPLPNTLFKSDMGLHSSTA